jgi:hypothetical protein
MDSLPCRSRTFFWRRRRPSATWRAARLGRTASWSWTNPFSICRGRVSQRCGARYYSGAGCSIGLAFVNMARILSIGRVADAMRAVHRGARPGWDSNRRRQPCLLRAQPRKGPRQHRKGLRASLQGVCGPLRPFLYIENPLCHAHFQTAADSPRILLYWIIHCTTLIVAKHSHIALLLAVLQTSGLAGDHVASPDRRTAYQCSVVKRHIHVCFPCSVLVFRLFLPYMAFMCSCYA